MTQPYPPMQQPGQPQQPFAQQPPQFGQQQPFAHPQFGQQQPFQSPVPPKKTGPSKLAVVGTLAAVVIGGGVLANMNKDTDNTTSSKSTQSPTQTTTAPASTTSSTSVSTTSTSAPSKQTTAPTSTQAASATSTQAPAPGTTFNAISARDFKLLAKNPDAYVGKGYIIYGVVTQFDSATGTSTFRADTGATKLKASNYYDFDQNTILDGDDSMLSKVVEGDLFQAKVIVSGAYTYDTTIGGTATVPRFAIEEISIYASKP